MSFENYDDVRLQFIEHGLVLDGELRVGGGRSMRCRVEGRGREKRGWYWLHEMPIDGRLYLVGAFGVYEGNNPGTCKVALTKQCEACNAVVPFKGRKCPACGSPKVKRKELSRDQQEALRTRMAEDRKRDEARRRQEAERAARIARAAWAKCLPAGACAYLERKGVAAHGARFTARGNLAVPMCDEHGSIHGLQIIYGDPSVKQRKGRDKDYWPTGLSKQGRFFLIGAPGAVVLLAEGFATGASLHEATGLPVAVAFDAGNLLPVAKVLHKRYRRARILVCADDDFLARCPSAACGTLDRVALGACPACATPYTHGNAGVEQAQAAALAVGGGCLAPTFASERGKKKLTDFNDLHLAPDGGLPSVRAQIEAKLDALGWEVSGVPALTHNGGGGARLALKPIATSEEIFSRFALIYGHKQTVFDFQERMLLGLDDMRNACTHREIHRRWMESTDKKIVRIGEIGFDPSGADPNITCNLWGGWPTEPRAGSCVLLLELLEYLCGEEKNSRDIYRWVLNWIAYPIQHAGAKMKTALVLHGPQGVGKNLFFEAVMAIYGEYGRIINQDAIEDKYNDWASKKLFLIADEIVARQELFHTKNKLKGLITSDWIRINPKHIAAHDERNHANLVFLSNETQPTVLERDDRRYAVIWTPPKLSEQLYKDVKAEIDAGGIAALHDHLLNLDLGGFAPHTPPPMTKGKQDLIDLSMDSTERFGHEWRGGHIEDVPAVPCKSQDLYRLYRDWCHSVGYSKPAPAVRFLAEIGKRIDARKSVARYLNGSGIKQATFVFPPGAEQPPDKTQPEWLGECHAQFIDAAAGWRELTKT